jgi:hypothetical protein
MHLFRRFLRVPKPDKDLRQEDVKMIKNLSQMWPMWDVSNTIGVSIMSSSSLITHLNNAFDHSLMNRLVILAPSMKGRGGSDLWGISIPTLRLQPLLRCIKNVRESLLIAIKLSPKEQNGFNWMLVPKRKSFAKPHQYQRLKQF